LHSRPLTEAAALGSVASHSNRTRESSLHFHHTRHHGFICGSQHQSEQAFFCKGQSRPFCSLRKMSWPVITNAITDRCRRHPAFECTTNPPNQVDRYTPTFFHFIIARRPQQRPSFSNRRNAEQHCRKCAKRPVARSQFARSRPH